MPYKDKEKLTEYQNAWQNKKRRENREKYNEMQKFYYFKSRENILARAKIYYSIYKDRINAKHREWYHNNKGYCKKYRHKYYLRKEKSLGTIIYPMMYKTPTYYLSRYRRKGNMPGIDEV